MHVHEFPCPYCGSRLRLRDRTLIGRTFPCPDCKGGLQVHPTGDGHLAALPQVSSSESSAGVERPTPEVSTRQTTFRQTIGETTGLPPFPAVAVSQSPTWRERLRSPTGIAWSVTALLGLAFLLWGLRSPEERRRADLRRNGRPQAAAPSAPSADRSTGAKVAPTPALSPDPVESDTNPAVAIVDPSLTEPPSAVIPDVPPAVSGAPIAIPAPANSAAKPDDVPNDQPIDVLLAADRPRFDIERGLAQPLSLFSQPTPIPVRELFEIIAEMAAVPVDWREVSAGPLAENLEATVSLELTETTVGGVLRAAVDAAGLDYAVSAEGIRIVAPASAPRTGI